MNGPLDYLLAQLCSADMAAAEKIFVAFEPYLRKTVRRHIPGPIRAQIDSAEIVQSVWENVLRGFREAGWRFIDADHLRYYLFVTTRNRLFDCIRHHQRAGDREEHFDEGNYGHEPPSPQPNAREILQADELWDWILANCSAEHRPILELRQQGLSLAEIGKRTGRQPDSVCRILRTLARQLALEGQKSRT
jgi:RNA polymerase sigma-70 factor (ECF subfamily)